MGTDKIYILQMFHVIREKYHAEPEHIRSVAVSEKVVGKLAWKGTVEVFRLQGHPKTTRCFAWKSDAEEIVTMLGIPPVFGPASAVQVALSQKAIADRQSP